MRNLLFVALVVLTGCSGGLAENTRQALSIVAPHDVDFEELHYYALRSQSAYDTPDKIRRDYPGITRVTILTSVDVRYFIEVDPASSAQTLSVRGTSDKENVWQDLETALVYDSSLASWLHSGFRKDASLVWADAKPHLRKGNALRVTGHSLGAAIALIVGGYAQAEGFNVTRVVNFGQPKVTSTDLLPEDVSVVTRVIDNLDVVPMLPPPGFAPKYRHEGEEVILRPGPFYVYLDAHAADRLSIADFWREFAAFSVKEHHMDHYLANLEFKIENDARQVPYLSIGK